jgi:hypothetical protein
MSLWELMHAVCVALAVAAADVPASVMKLGAGGHVLATALGLLIGLGFAWVMWNSGRFLGARIRRLPRSLHEGRFRLMYFGAFVWMALAGILSAVVSHFVLSLAF